MARVINASSDEFNALIHGLPSQNSINFIKNQARVWGETIGGLTGAAKDMFQNVYETVTGYDFSSLIDRVTGISNVHEMDTPDLLTMALTVMELQSANLTTQRWNMANPTLRGLVHEGRCDGYSDTYFDYEPDYVGMEHTDYQEVINGFRLIDDEGLSYAINIRDTFEDPDLMDLTVSQQTVIQSNWARIECAIAEGGEDPSSVFGEVIQ